MSAPSGLYLPSNYLELLSDAIDQQAEGPKVDFKRELNLAGEGLAEFLKDVCAIANTDDEDHFDDYGYLIIGFDKHGAHHPLDTAFNADALNARVSTLLSNHVTPIPPVQITGPHPHSRGDFAVVVISPSTRQPHMVTRPTGTFKRGDWWVRNGTTTELAGPLDYQRVLEKAVRRATESTQQQLSTLHGRLESLSDRYENLYVKAVQGLSPGVDDAPGLSTAHLIASTYSTSPERRLVRHLQDEVLAFSTAFQKVSLGVQHWNAVTNQLDAWKTQILEFEEMTRSLAEALAAAVMYADGQLDEAVLRSLKEVCQVVTTWPGNQSMTDSEETTRAYPLSLLLFIVFTASLRTNRGALLKHIASQTSRQFHHDRLWMYELRYLVSLDERFETAFNIESCAPAYQRLHDVVVGGSGWLSLELPFGEAKELGLKADLLLSLVLTDYDMSLRESGPGTEFSGSTPIPNVLLYRLGASEVVRDLFKHHRALLTSALKNTPEEVYAEVSRNSQSYRPGNRMRCWSQLSLDALTNQ